jgi:LuxR family maltose regulon positive regulatory protein
MVSVDNPRTVYSGIPSIRLSRLKVPVLPRSHITRRALFQQLIDSLDWRCVFVSASVGCGKSIMLAEWYQVVAAREGWTASWLSIDEQSMSQVSFWCYIRVALQDFWPELLKEVVAPSSPSDIQVFLSTLSNYILSHNDRRRDCLFFIDNLQCVSASTLSQLIDFIALDLPENIHVVLASDGFTFDGVDLSALEVACEITTEDLLLSLDETAELVHQIIGRRPGRDNVETLQDLTEGLVAGVRVGARLIDQSTPVDHETLAEGLCQHLNAFFVNRVFGTATHELEEFLLETSFLERLTVSLCDAMTGRRNSEYLLQMLAAKNLVAPCDSQSHWFKYHSLLLIWLRSRALPLNINITRELNFRASEWFERNNMPAEAAKHMLLAGDYKLFEQLTSSSSFSRPANSGGYQSWLLRNDACNITRSPYLSLLATWAYVICGRPQDALSWLKIFESIFDGLPANNPAASSTSDALPEDFDEEAVCFNVACVRMKCVSLMGEHSKTISMVEEFLGQHERQMDASLRCMTIHTLAESQERTGRLEEAQERYLEAEAVASLAGLQFYIYFIRYLYGIIQYLFGRLRTVENHCYRALRDCPEDLPPYGALYCLLARAQLETGRIEQAEVSLKRAVKRLSSIRNLDLLGEAYTTQAFLLCAQERWDEAYERIVQTVLMAENSFMARGAIYPIYVAQAQIALMRHNTADARVAERKLSEQVSSEDLINVLPLNTIQAQLLALSGEENEACARFARIARQALAAHLNYYAVEPMLFEAVLHYRMKRKGSALACFREALALGSSCGFLSSFANHREMLRPLLNEVLNVRKVDSSLRNYARGLQAAFEKRDVLRRRNLALTEPPTIKHELGLTRREIEVTHLLNTGMTRSEISEALNISINTTKTHINAIFAKLGVSSRQEVAQLYEGEISPS